MNSLLVGHKYSAFQPAFSMEISDSEIIEFKEKHLTFIVLEKPTEVSVDDGQETWIEPLPKHLAQNDWYLVENIASNNQHWFHAKCYDITPII